MVKKHQMSKKETLFVLFTGATLFFTPVYGDVTVGILHSIENNAKVQLHAKNTRVECEAFGVIVLEKMVQNAVNSKECMAEIEMLYHSSPHDKVYAREHLMIKQSYHFEKIKEGCILYANGPETYSEMLLSSGLAIIDPKFNNSEWNARLREAQKRAERQNIGLYSTQIRKICTKEEK